VILTPNSPPAGGTASHTIADTTLPDPRNLTFVMLLVQVVPFQVLITVPVTFTRTGYPV
jgi:hypothetical protein